MGTGASIFLLALGAVLTFAIETDSTESINVNNVGIILMLIGVVGLVIYALMMGRPERWVQRGSTAIDGAPVIRQQVVERRVVSQPVVEEQVVTERPVVERHISE